jgi:glycosyltransferase involved in cell wall biosynthesis
MKVGVNTLFLIPEEVGGSETYLRETLLALLEYFPQIRFVLFTNRENHPMFLNLFQREQRVDFCLLNFPATNRYLRIIREQTELPIQARRSSIDLLWSPGYTAPLFSHCPQVVSIFDMQYRNYPEDLTPLAWIVTHFLVTMATQKNHFILTLSHFSKQEILKYSSLAENRIYITPLSADPEFGQPIPPNDLEAFLSRLLHPKTPYLLCVSNSYPHKNLPRLLEAFGQLEQEIPHSLILVGQPRLGEKELRKAIHRLRDPNRLIRLPYVSKKDLMHLYQGAEVFVFPSLYEGFGLPVLEAMTAGTPVVTTHRAAIPEVGSDCVFYFEDNRSADLAGKIRMVLNLPAQKRQEYADHARKKALEFSWKRTAEGTIECFQAASGKNIL